MFCTQQVDIAIALPVAHVCRAFHGRRFLIEKTRGSQFVIALKISLGLMQLLPKEQLSELLPMEISRIQKYVRGVD